MDYEYEDYAKWYNMMFTPDKDEELFLKLCKKYGNYNKVNTSLADYIWLLLKFEEPSDEHPCGMMYIDWMNGR